MNDNDEDDNAPWRVFLQGTMIPSLPMSRSIGDALATRVGAIPMLDFWTQAFSHQDCFLVVVNDGLWQVFTGQEEVE